MDTGNIGHSGANRTRSRTGAGAHKERGFVLDVFHRDLCGIQVEVPSRQLKTREWNSVESSGQDKERGWESSEYKKTHKL